MKTKLGMVILAVACAGLAIALFATKRVADERLKNDASAILDFSNQWVNASEKIDDLRQVNLTLTNDLAVSRQEAVTFSNQFVETSGALADTNAALQGQITNLNSRLADLESQNQVLDQRAAALTNAIASLNAQIADTQQKLTDTETNNTFLEKELQQQTAARAELENKFNNLSVVRTQVKKLRDDAFVARRLQWMRDGTDPASQAKAGLLQMQRPAPTAGPASPPHYDLNVEVSSDGSIHVGPAPTNAPATPAGPPP